MRVGLFIPCYVDQLYPEVGLATLRLLRRLGCEVEYPEAQTCCGQPMANTGVVSAARPLAERYEKVFADYEYVVCPSGSCVSMVRNHFDQVLGRSDDHHGDEAHAPRNPSCDAARPSGRTWELCEFLVDVLRLDRLDVRFPHRVGLHQSCHGLRELRLGSSSERVGARFSKVRQVLELVEGIEFCELSRVDECCGFGGTFAVSEEGVSCRMGLDRLADHRQAGSEVIVGNDMSCLMHLEGLLRRRGESTRVMHVAQILAG
ncbi:MAG TPA: Fe-S oxidoreductase [Planctomycetaceae bacterium]|nr:Fe-S oxidoreductase [Planctomycetaceae bacterium]HRF00935.1 (Fe-S)-binding protein [Pirellulaceae bacterium]